MTVSNDGINTHHLIICHAEVKRRNVHRYRDAKIVRINLRQSILLLGITDGLRAG
jgi:hypothetical protein